MSAVRHLAIVGLTSLLAVGACGRGRRAIEPKPADAALDEAPLVFGSPDAAPDNTVAVSLEGMVRIPGGHRFLMCDKAVDPECVYPDPRPTQVGCGSGLVEFNQLRRRPS